MNDINVIVSGLLRNLENREKSGNSKIFPKVREYNFFLQKPGKVREKNFTAIAKLADSAARSEPIQNLPFSLSEIWQPFNFRKTGRIVALLSHSFYVTCDCDS